MGSLTPELGNLREVGLKQDNPKEGSLVMGNPVTVMGNPVVGSLIAGILEEEGSFNILQLALS